MPQESVRESAGGLFFKKNYEEMTIKSNKTNNTMVERSIIWKLMGIITVVIFIMMPSCKSDEPDYSVPWGFSFKKTAGGASVTYVPLNQEVIKIPEKVRMYDGVVYDVVGIEGGFTYNCAVKTLYVPSTIRLIYPGFYVKVEKLYLTSVESWLSINMKDNINNANNAYVSRVFLTPIDNKTDIYIDGELLTDLTVPGIFSYVGSGFRNSNIKTLKFDKGVEKIGMKAFEGCSEITSVKLPEGVVEIRDEAFKGCSRLETVELPRSLTKIGWGAFEDTESLSSVNFPDRLDTICRYAFKSAKNNIKSFTFPSSLKYIGECAFGSFGYKEFNIPSMEWWWAVEKVFVDRVFPNGTIGHHPGVYFIVGVPKYTLKIDGEEVKDVVIPSYITTLHSCAFTNSTINSITFSGNEKKLLDFSLMNCENLTEIKLPNSLRYIGMGALRGCSGIKEIEIPEGVRGIGIEALVGCSSLTTLTVASTVNEFNFNLEGCENIRTINMKCREIPVTPARVDLIYKYFYVPEKVLEEATLYVPTGCLDVYRNNKEFGAFKNIVEKDF